jgi:hypothetical protein
MLVSENKSVENGMAGETLEQFRVEKSLVVFDRPNNIDHPELCYVRDAAVLSRVEQTFAKKGNVGDAAVVRSAIKALSL